MSRLIVLLLALLAIMLLVPTVIERFEPIVGKDQADQNPAGCPCSSAEDCLSLHCKGGLCADRFGAVPARWNRYGIRCPRAAAGVLRSYKAEDLAAPGCPCTNSAECRWSSCRGGRCQNWFGFTPRRPDRCPSD